MSTHGPTCHLPVPALRAAWLCACCVIALPIAASGQTSGAAHEQQFAHERQALGALQDAFSAIADQLEPAVVTVFSTRAARIPIQSEMPPGMAPFRGAPRRYVATGSGVIIAPDGWILTNDHVVGSADRVTVRLHDGREFAGSVRSDYRSDLALVKISTSTPLPTARLGDSDRVKIGNWAIAIGSPYRYEGSFSVGVISSLFRSQRILDYGAPMEGRFYPDMIQTDAAINPGNSGGPLCNIDGEVIGINTAIESENGGSVGIGFAIPINTATFVIAQLKERGRVSYGYLGVSPTSVVPRVAEALKVDRGALLDQDPDPSSPAAKAGLTAGDVVTSIEGRPVRNELDLRTIIAHTAPGTTVSIGIVRDGRPSRVRATLAEAPMPGSELRQRALPRPRLGIEVASLTKKQIDQMGLAAAVRGVVIRSVDPMSSAADVDDMTEGAVIVRVNDHDTPEVGDFEAATANLKSGDAVRIYTIVRMADSGRYVRRFDVVEIE